MLTRNSKPKTEHFILRLRRSMLHAASLAPCCFSCSVLTLCSLLLLLLLSAPCFAQGIPSARPIERLPSLPSLPPEDNYADADDMGRRYDAPEEPRKELDLNKLGFISNPERRKGEFKRDKEAEEKFKKYNKGKIAYQTENIRIDNRIEKPGDGRYDNIQDSQAVQREDGLNLKSRVSGSKEWGIGYMPYLKHFSFKSIIGLDSMLSRTSREDK